MKILRLVQSFTIITVVFSSFVSFNPLKASAFDETEIEQSQVVAIARPYGDNKYDLLVIEQIPGKQQCWQENGTNPTLIDPLLMNFDFTGICRRATDSNGYSIRLDGQDYGLDYMLRIVERNGELVLVGTNRTDPSKEIVVGTTKGLSSGFLKIQLEPGWRFSKRTYQGKVLGHFYFSGKQAEIGNSTVTPTETPETSVQPPANNSL